MERRECRGQATRVHVLNGTLDSGSLGALCNSGVLAVDPVALVLHSVGLIQCSGGTERIFLVFCNHRSIDGSVEYT
jgi:hypothetical protein